jgi:hypothetical protein
MPKLGEMLLAEGICTVEQLKAAVENQVIMGGRIGTNLLELGFISEEALAKILAQQFRTRVLFGDDISPDREALAKIPKDAVARLDVIPYRLEERSIHILCIDPGDLKALDEVAFITGLKPTPIAVPELRFWQLLNRLYGIERELRYLVLEGSSLPVKVQDRPQAEPTVQEDLISEEVFAKLYQRKEDQPEPDEIPVLDEADMEIVEEEVIELVDEVAPEPEESPLTFQEATQLLKGVDDRNAVARTVLRFAASVFKRCLLFTTHQQVIIGWDAVGGNIDPARFRSLAIPLNTPSVFQLVVNSRAHFLGGLQKTKINIGFLKAMGKQVPLSAVVVPILVRERVVNLLYCDNGHRAHAASDIGELLILAQRTEGPRAPQVPPDPRRLRGELQDHKRHGGFRPAARSHPRHLRRRHPAFGPRTHPRGHRVGSRVAHRGAFHVSQRIQAHEGPGAGGAGQRRRAALRDRGRVRGGRGITL